MLFYTGIVRNSTDIAAFYIPDIKTKQKQLSAYRHMVEEACEILIKNRPFEEFGRLLHEAWFLKKSLSKEISRAEIDGIYDAALAAGAWGGKIIGAGGGGFLLLFAPPQAQAAIRMQLKDLLEVPFEFDKHGSQIIFYDPEAHGQEHLSPTKR
jgi:D-glycero-alpha-D-manno-heptose-7-phosphate kinase